MKKPLTEAEALDRIKDALATMHDDVAGEWPLREAFTDLDDHPYYDDHPAFNWHVGLVLGLCDAFGLDPCTLADEVEAERASADRDES